MVGPEPTFYCSCTQSSVYSLCYSCIYHHRDHDYFICNSYDGVCYCAEITHDCDHSRQGEIFYELCSRQDAQECFLEQIRHSPSPSQRSLFALFNKVNATDLTDAIKYALVLGIHRPKMLKRISAIEPFRSYFVKLMLLFQRPLPGDFQPYELLLGQKDAYSALNKAQTRELFRIVGRVYQNMALYFALYFPRRMFYFAWEDIILAESALCQLWDVNATYSNSNEKLHCYFELFRKWTAYFSQFAHILLSGVNLPKVRAYDLIKRIEIVKCPEDQMIMYPQFLLAILIGRLSERGGSLWIDMAWSETDVGLSIPQYKMNYLIQYMTQNYDTWCAIMCGKYKRNSEDLFSILLDLLLNGSFRFAELNAFVSIHRYCEAYRPNIKDISAAAAHKIQGSKHWFSASETTAVTLSVLDQAYQQNILENSVSWITGDESMNILRTLCNQTVQPFCDTLYELKPELIQQQDFLLTNPKYRRLSGVDAVKLGWELRFPQYDETRSLQEFYARIRGATEPLQTDDYLQQSLSLRLLNLREKHSKSYRETPIESEINKDQLAPAPQTQQVACASTNICDLCHESLYAFEFLPVAHIKRLENLQQLDIWATCGHCFHFMCAFNTLQLLNICPVCKGPASKLIRRGLQMEDQKSGEFAQNGVDAALEKLMANSVLARDDVDIQAQIEAVALARSEEQRPQAMPDARLATLGLEAVLRPSSGIASDSEWENAKSRRVEPRRLVFPETQLDALEARCGKCGSLPELCHKVFCTQCGRAYHQTCFYYNSCCGSVFLFHPASMLVYNSSSQRAFLAPYRDFRGQISTSFYGPKFSVDWPSLEALTASLLLGHYRTRRLSFYVPFRRVPRRLQMPLAESSDDFAEVIPYEI